MLAPPLAEFSTARRPDSQPDFTAASREEDGGAAEGSEWAFLIFSATNFVLLEKFPTSQKWRGRTCALHSPLSKSYVIKSTVVDLG